MVIFGLAGCGLGPVIGPGDLPSSGIAIELASDRGPTALVFVDPTGKVLGHVPGASFDSEDSERVIALPGAVPAGLGGNWFGHGCADLGDGFESCHRRASPSGNVPTLHRDGVEVLGASHWVDNLAQRGVEWVEDPGLWPGGGISQTVVGAWASDDDVALQLAAECETPLVGVLSDGALSYVDEGSAQVFAGWLDSDRFVYTQVGGCGEAAPSSVVIRHPGSAEALTVLEVNTPVRATVWTSPLPLGITG